MESVSSGTMARCATSIPESANLSARIAPDVSSRSPFEQASLIVNTPARIIANTPRLARESWTDILTAAWKWIIDPRAAMGVFTAVLVLGWLGNLAGISPDWGAVVRDPSAIYYGAQGAMNRAYDEAIRAYYRSPLVTQIQSRIEQFREIS